MTFSALQYDNSGSNFLLGWIHIHALTLAEVPLFVLENCGN